MVEFSLPSFRYAAIIFIPLLLTACGPVITHPAPFEDLVMDADRQRGSSYRIGVGDEVEVKFYFAPELTDVIQVRPDGRISLMFAQDIMAAGRTPEELADIISAKLAPRVRQRDLVVLIRNYASQKVFVSGEVMRSGPVQLYGGENLLQVLNQVGWVLPTARRDEIVLIRRGTDGLQSVYPVNIDKIISGEDMSQNVAVQAGDTIIVPPSDVASFDRWNDQHIRQALPLNTGVVITNQYNSQ